MMKSISPGAVTDGWREGPVVSADRQFAIGAIFSSPLVANGVVYFGSMVSSTRWSEEIRAGRALLGTDAPITSRAFRNQHSRALGKGLIRIVGSLAAATSRRLCFRTDSWSCHRHRELFLLCWVQGRGRTCRTR